MWGHPASSDCAFSQRRRDQCALARGEGRVSSFDCAEEERERERERESVCVCVSSCLCFCVSVRACFDLRTDTRPIRALAWSEALGRRPKHCAELRADISIQPCARSRVGRRSEKVVVMGSLPVLEDDFTFGFPWHAWVSLAPSAACLLPRHGTALSIAACTAEM